MSDSSLLNLVAEEFIALVRSGKRPSVEEYAGRYPDLADDIRDLFPTAIIVEKAKLQKQFGRAAINGGVAFGSRSVETLGDYRIIREIGRGGMGIVYEAEQTSLSRRVALKVLRGDTDAGKARRFRREAKAAASLHHTNIVPILGVGEQDGIHYFVMQLIDGVSLDLLLCDEPQQYKTTKQFARIADTDNIQDKTTDTSSGPTRDRSDVRVDKCDWQEIATQVEGVARALHYAHQQGVLHRDVKPGNLILDADDRIWVTDFGLAKQMGDEGVTTSGDVVGTLRYMSPEQFNGSFDPRGDVYSLGLTLYELATRRPAFEGTDHAQIVQRILHGEPARPRVVNSEVPRDLETIILKAIARDSDHRYQTASGLADDLHYFSQGQPIKARRIKPVERLWRWCRRNPAVALPTIASGLLLLVVAFVATLGYKVASHERGIAERNLATANKERHRAEQNLTIANNERQRAEDNLSSAQHERKRAEASLEIAQRERERAETNLSLSMNVIEDVFDRIAPTRLPETTDDPMTAGPMTAGPVESEREIIVSPDELALLESMLRFYDQFAQENDLSNRLQHEAAGSHRRVGQIHQRLGNVEDARLAFERSLDLYEHLAEQQSIAHPDWTIAAAIHNDLGIALGMLASHSEAREHHRKAREVLLEQIKEVPNATGAQLELVRTYNLLGYAVWGTCRKKLDVDTPALITRAEDSHRAALELLEKLISFDRGNPEYQLMLARSYRDLSPVLFWRRRRDDAIDATNKSIEILENLVQQFPGSPEYCYELMRVYSQWDRRLWGDKGIQEGERRYKRAIALADELSEAFPNVPEYSARAVYNRYKLGNVLPWSSRRDDAEQLLRRVIELQQTQISRYPDLVQHQLFLIKARNLLARLHLKFNEYDEARSILEESIEAAKSLPTEKLSSRKQRSARELFAQQYSNLGKAFEGLGKDEQAQEAVRRAKELHNRQKSRT